MPRFDVSTASPLRAYMHGMDDVERAEFCKAVDCSRSHIEAIASGNSNAGKRLARRIFEVTKGKIKPEDVMHEEAV